MSVDAIVDRPWMPAGYGIQTSPDGMLEWEEVETRLKNSRNYWVCTTRPDRRPHAMPVWGIWLDGALHFGTDRDSRKGRNLAANPAVAVHLESGDDVVILEGNVSEATDTATLERYADAYEAKYQWRPDATPGQGPFVLRPRVVMAWRERDFPTSPTRWRFPGR